MGEEAVGLVGGRTGVQSVEDRQWPKSGLPCELQGDEDGIRW